MQHARANLDRPPYRALAHRLTWPAALLATTLAGPALAQPQASDTEGSGDIQVIQSASEEADELHRQAMELLDPKVNRWEEALPLLERAHSLKPTFDITANLAYTLSALERHVEAAHYFQEAKVGLPTNVHPDAKEKFDNNFNQVRAKVGIARVLIEPGASVYVDGKEAKLSPVDLVNETEKLIFVAPGEHAFQARRGDARSAEVPKTLVAGQEQLVELGPLNAEGGPPPPGDDGSVAPSCSAAPWVPASSSPSSEARPWAPASASAATPTPCEAKSSHAEVPLAPEATRAAPICETRWPTRTSTSMRVSAY